MAKVLATVSSVDLVNDSPYLMFTVCVIGPPHLRYVADYKIDITVSLEKNINALKNIIADYVVQNGFRISVGDIILFGAPEVKDTTSFKSEVNGITSDSTAVTKEPQVALADSEPATEPSMVARWIESVKNLWNA